MKKVYIILFCLFMAGSLMAQWYQQNSGTTNSLSSVYFPDANTGYAVGVSGTILKTTDAGANWILQNSGTDQILMSVYFLDLMTGFCVGDSGTIIKTTSGGSTWNLLQIDSTINLSSVWFPNDSVGYIAGSRVKLLIPHFYEFDAIILKTDDYGNNWSEIFVTDGGLSSVCFPSQDTGYAGGFIPGVPPQKIFLKTEDGGENWLVTPMGAYGDFSSLCFIDNESGYAAAGAVYITKDGGINWTTCGVGSGWSEWILYFLNNGTGYTIGYHEFGGAYGIHKTIDDGVNWIIQDSALISQPSDIFFPTYDTGYIVGSDGFILRTTNGGGLPTEVRQPSVFSNKIQTYPNPFTGETTFRISLDEPTQVNLVFMDRLGRLVATVLNEPLGKGNHHFTWNAEGLPSGIYFYHLTTGNLSSTGKLVVVR